MFEIKYTTKSGHLFHVILPREVNGDEAHQLAQLALNITETGNAASDDDEQVFGPQAPQSTTLADHINVETNVGGQTKLGEFPVDYINLLSYKEPAHGVRIKMLHFPQAKMKALKVFRDITNIGIMGSRDVVCGNYRCPILSLEMANKIMVEFRKLDVYAKIVPLGAVENRGDAA
jgi:hypothetical protein